MNKKAGQKTSLIIPAYNEEAGLPKTVEEALPFVSEIIIIDDGSKDNTYKNALGLKSKYKKIKIIHHEKNLGKVAALREGVKRASGDLIVFTDADFTHPAEYIPLFIKELNKGADLALGNRITLGIKNIPIFNRFGNVLFSFLISYIGCGKIEDGQTGYRAFRKKDFTSLDVWAQSLEYETKMTVNALKKGYKVVEIPIVYRPRIGKSKLHPIRDGYRMIKSIISIAYRQTSLIAKFVILPSFVFTILGLTFGFISLYEKIKYTKLLHEYYPLISVFLLLIAIQLFSIGFILDHFSHKLDRILEKTKDNDKKTFQN